ncbi:DHA2 family efflux MFS transporter permease subunit [Luteipulveratus halotolerans]|uniref:DHA2 family efflux MFS transporter permease subunit n=1 Tax=Luteipulveratus halotolerans TaxID=1631356 RepID=UPI0006801FD8|nr:DHA2 family efflux MFS transporter permease subunit [Luteipulveratus halotolerans]
MTILTHAAGPERMGRLMAILGVPMLLGPILGPIIGGVLIDHASWHWIFLINLPLGIAAIAYAAWALPGDETHPSESFDFLGMLLMSPGLALFLYGVSSIPEEGTIAAAKVLIPMIVGAVLIVAFVFHTFRPEHPLLDLRLFKNKNLTVSIITMFLFVAAFFGGLLLVPTYLQQIRGESVTNSGLLMAAQGIGAMVTMPLAGALADKMPIGRFVPIGLVLITGGMFGLSRIDESTSYWGYIIPVLFVMGLGMGATMMPIMTSALKTLRGKEIARGSTLINIVQQVGSSVGVAIMSVLLTNHFNNSNAVQAGQKLGEAQQVGTPQAMQQAQQDPVVIEALKAAGGSVQKLTQMAMHEGAEAFASTFVVASILVALTFIPAFFLPRKPLETPPAPEGEGGEEVPVLMH